MGLLDTVVCSKATLQKRTVGTCAVLVSRHGTLRLAHQHAINPGTGEEPAPNEKVPSPDRKACFALVGP